MNPLNVPGLFAAGDYVGLIVIVVALVGWLYNLASGKTPSRPPPVQRPRQPARPRDGRLQDEIDIFIKEVSPNKAKPAQNRPPAPARAPVGKKPAAPLSSNLGRNQGRKPAKPFGTQESAQPVHRTPGADLAKRSAPGSTNLGNALRQQVAQQVPEHKVDREVEADLRNRLGSSVGQHLGSFDAAPLQGAAVAGQQGNVKGAMLYELLRKPASIQQAILINAILSPPLGRRMK